MRTVLFILLASLVIVSCHRPEAQRIPVCCGKAAAPMASPLPDPLSANASIYQLPGVWTDQYNRSITLNELKGKVQVVAMIFTHCGYACPRIVQEMKAMEDSLSAAERRDVGFVLVSFDAERDDAAHLAQFAEQQGLDGRWVLLHGSPEQVRELSMLLEVRYKRLEDGNYTHSNVIVILDRNGGIEKTLPGLEPGKDSAVQIIGRLAAR